jgi:hypothetical protein
MDAVRLIRTIADWAKTQPTIRAVALVGSNARGTARADSDIDLVLLATDPKAFRAHASWIDAIEWNVIGVRPMRWEDEDYGELWSRRLWLEQDGEVEFGFASTTWADVNPVDPGTRSVIVDGCRILHDPEKILSRLCATASAAAL